MIVDFMYKFCVYGYVICMSILAFFCTDMCLKSLIGIFKCDELIDENGQVFEPTFRFYFIGAISCIVSYVLCLIFCLISPIVIIYKVAVYELNSEDIESEGDENEDN